MLPGLRKTGKYSHGTRCSRQSYSEFDCFEPGGFIFKPKN